MKKKIGIFLPGRLKSERLSNKLLLPLGNDKTLWSIACEKLNSLPDKYNKYALIHDRQLIEIARRYPGIKIIKRDVKTIGRDGPLTYIFGDLSNLPDTHLMFLNPCVSFLSKATIVRSLEKFNRSAQDYATSVKPFQNWLFDTKGRGITPIDYKMLNTKTIPVMYQAAHAFHLFPRAQFFKDGKMLKPGHLILPIAPEEAVDVDTREDYNYVRWLYHVHCGNRH